MPAPAEAGRTRALQYRFSDYLRDPEKTAPLEGIEQRRLDLYAELVFNNVEGLLTSNFPVISRLYGEEAWLRFVREFFAEHQSRTPLFLEIGREFQRYIEERMERGVDDPPFLLELAHYEWAELALSIDENDIASIAHDPHGDPVHGVPVFSPLAWPLGYRFPVHHIGPEFRPQKPSENPTLLLLVRDRSDTVSFIEINPLTTLLIQRLQENVKNTGLECLQALLIDMGSPDDPAMLQGGIAVLHNLKEREAILGTVP
jgi:hypothetical protein